MINSVFEHEQKVISPVMIGAPALMLAATARDALEEVLFIMEKLDPKPDFWIQWYKTGIERFQYWGYVDLLTILFVASEWIKPESYLEIGSGAGRSACIVGGTTPDCGITAVDLWPVGNLALVDANLKHAGHKGHVNLIRGDSHQELPKLKGKKYDLILVDGDHTKEGAVQDLRHVVPMLNIGGALVFDDFCVPWLNEAWSETVKRNGKFSTAEYRESGAGVAVGILRR